MMTASSDYHIPQTEHIRHTVTSWALRAFAMIALPIQIGVLLIFWPVPELGMIPKPQTGIILAITPNSASDQAGLRIGDRITHIYTYAWHDISRQVLLIPLAWDTPRSVPLRIERDGHAMAFAIPMHAPSRSFQFTKIVACIVGMVCWLTGVIIGIVHRQAWPYATRVGWFWIVTGLIAGIYTFARYSSYPLTLALQWLLCTVIAPLAAAMHVWFPPRPIHLHHLRHGRLAILIALGLMNGILITLAFQEHWSILLIIETLSIVMPAVLALSLLISALVLIQTVLHAPTAHIQRQARLILVVTTIIGLCWLGLRSLPALLDLEVAIPDGWLDLLVASLPLAYLFGSIVPDLYRVDRVLMRVGGHVMTLLLVMLIISVVVHLLDLHGPLAMAGIALSLVVLYQPVYRLGGYLTAPLQRRRSYAPLDHAAAQMLRTLDRTILARILCQGIAQTFDSPPMGLYLQDTDESEVLSLVYQQRLHLPPHMRPGRLLTQLHDLPLLAHCRTIQTALTGQSLTDAEQALLHHPGIALWCSLRIPGLGVHGVLLLGLRADLDPYRRVDLQALQRFFHTAILALTNSGTYHAQIESAQTIRQLYQQLQRVEDDTRSTIAHEIHDEVINVMVRLNILSLQQLLQDIDDPFLREELRLILEGEQATTSVLRDICERLSPTNMEDPFGLPGAIRGHLDMLQKVWSGACHFVMHGTPVPITPTIQREAMRVVRESLTNAMKHTTATDLTVHLTYPHDSAAMVSLAIQDNGRSPAHIRPRRGTWGVRSMEERAYAVGGTLTFDTPASGGTTVFFMFPATMKEEAHAPIYTNSISTEPLAALTPPTECGLSREYGCTS